MNKTAFIEFLQEAKAQGASGQDVSELIKEASGEQIDPAQLDAMMAQMPQGPQGAPGGPGAGGPPPQDPSQDPMMTPPGHPQHQGHPGGHPHGGHGGELPLSGEQIDQIAQLIAQHLQEQEAQGGGHDMQGMPPDQQQQMEMAKTSEYIGEFIKRGSEYGIDADTSVNMYCTMLDNAFGYMKSAVEHDKEVAKIATEVDEETLSYYQGVAEKAASANWTYEQTLDALRKQGADKKLKEQFTNKK